MPNLHDSNPYNKTGHRPLPATFDTDFINHINHGLFDNEAEPAPFFAELHQQFDATMGASEVARHIVAALQGTEFESAYALYVNTRNSTAK